MITGGTGSFGNAVLKKILKTNIKEIRILSRDEKKQYDLRKKINDDRLKFYLGDIRDYSSVLEATNPKIVINIAGTIIAGLAINYALGRYVAAPIISNLTGEKLSKSVRNAIGVTAMII